MLHVADVQIDDCRSVAHGGHLPVRADIGRPVKSRRDFSECRFSLFLPWHPPTARLFRALGIADVENDQYPSPIARHVGREIRVFAARIGIAMRASRTTF